MTLDGPEPADERSSPFDYEHYVDKQLEPIAEPGARGARSRIPTRHRR